MHKEFVFAGFGGQGVLTAGMVLAYTGAAKDYDVTWIPSYGTEMRGGTANCTVKLSDEEIANPFYKRPDILVAMNKPSLLKFMDSVKKGGSIIVNSTIIHEMPEVEGVDIHMVPVSDIAAGLGNARSANLCALGAAVAVAEDIISIDDAADGISGYFTKIKDNGSNIAVLKAGYAAVKQPSADV
ncbi:MAG: 2-oxoacid:acceptor oxidoreductase family protein [Clostridiales Family XIII bacterium]|jgi:2-oxoglutarate ferredoxin oxidoreductase subunit gamma|nr:2-oxoacid:acceptor oxidoreductase family protein [Clostridiales Family XIII bacterium]